MTSSTPDDAVARALRTLAAGGRPDAALTAEAFAQVMRGEATPAQMGALLMALRVQREAADQLEGAVRALRGAMVTVEITDHRLLVDTCGTGGGTVPTFNISTAAALVAVGAGARVAKHGNRSFTSRCGSADVLEALGIAIALEPARASELLDEVGMAFLFAPAFHPAMRHVAPVRRELGVATVMNMIGPLANPAGVRRQLVGVADPERGPLMAEVLARTGAERALVVYATVGMDEIAPRGVTRVWEVADSSVTEREIEPQRFAMTHERLEDLAGGSPEDNARRIDRLLTTPSDDPAGRAAVVLNAGAALYAAGLHDELDAAMEAAQASLEGGRAAGVLERLRAAAPLSTSE